MSRPAYNDAEEGMLDVHSPPLAANPLLTKNEGPIVLGVSLQSSKKNVLAWHSMDPPRPDKLQKMKISKYVHFVIWYNSYKLVLSTIIPLSHSCHYEGGFSQSSSYSTLSLWALLRLIFGHMLASILVLSLWEI